MKTTLTLLIAALLIGSFFLAGCDEDNGSPASNGIQGNNLLLVANQNSDMISVINLDNDEVYQNRVGVGHTPNDLIYHDEKLYVINSMSSDLNIFTISDENVFSTYHDPIDLSGNIGNSPQYGAITQSGILCISNYVTNRVTTLSLENYLLGVDISLDPYPGAADVLAIGNKIYVCCSGFDGSNNPGAVTVIDTETSFTKGIIQFEAGKNPQHLALDPSGKLHVSCSGEWGENNGEINVIDPETNTIVRYYYFNSYISDIAITSAGIAYIVYTSAEGDPGAVYRYNTYTGEILNDPSNPIVVGSGAYNVIVGPDNEVYVSCYYENTVDKIVDGLKIKSYPVGDGPIPMEYISR